MTPSDKAPKTDLDNAHTKNFETQCFNTRRPFSFGLWASTAAVVPVRPNE